MITKIRALLVSNLHLTSLPARFTNLVLAALCSFAFAAPSAFADCSNKALARYVTSPASPAVAQSAAAPLNTLKNPPSIVGLWNVTFSSGGQVVDVAFDAWHSDGTEILNDYTNPIEGNVCLGVYQQIGPLTYKLKHPSWSFDTNGNLQGTVVIHETVTLSPDGISYYGSYRYDIYDTAGVFLEELTGTIKATRIHPD